MRKFTIFMFLSLTLVLAACNGDEAETFTVTLESDTAEADELIADPTGEIEAGESVQITAPEVDGYTFLRWEDEASGDEISTSNPLTFTIEADVHYVAVYEADDDDDETDPETITVTLESDTAEADELIADPTGEIEAGESVQITAPEVDGYTFLHWEDEASGDEISTDNPYTFTAETNVHYVAVYEADDDADEPVEADGVGDVWDADYDDNYETFTPVEVHGIVVGESDQGFILMDSEDGRLISIHDEEGSLTVGDHVLLDAEYNVTWDVSTLTNVDEVEVLESSVSFEWATDSAIAIDWDDYDTPGHNHGQLIEIDGFWARFAGTAANQYLRIGENEANVDAEAYDGSYIGLQNGANNANLDMDLVDYFPAANDDDPADYTDTTLYAFLYDTSSSYEKFIILDDSLIVTD